MDQSNQFLIENCLLPPLLVTTEQVIAIDDEKELKIITLEMCNIPKFWWLNRLVCMKDREPVGSVAWLNLKTNMTKKVVYKNERIYSSTFIKIDSYHVLFESKEEFDKHIDNVPKEIMAGYKYNNDITIMVSRETCLKTEEELIKEFELLRSV